MKIIRIQTIIILPVILLVYFGFCQNRRKITPHPIDSGNDNDMMEGVPAKGGNTCFHASFSLRVRNVGRNPGCRVENVDSTG